MMDPKLFNAILLNVQKILRYNYSENFYKEKQLELLSIPIQSFKSRMPPFDFNSIGPDAQGRRNIFELMLTRKNDGSQKVNRPPVALP